MLQGFSYFSKKRIKITRVILGNFMNEMKVLKELNSALFDLDDANRSRRFCANLIEVTDA